MGLTILTVTRAEPYAWALLERMAALSLQLSADLTICADGPEAMDALVASRIGERAYHSNCIIRVQSKGYIESVLDQAVSACGDGYILRLDDDESCSPKMVEWLKAAMYLEHDHWQFPRVHLIQDEQHYLDDIQLFPDFQTRLSSKLKSGGRHHLHAASPFGGGTIAPVAIAHHKFLVKTYEQRQVISQKWHTGGMTAFSLPEDMGRPMNVRPVTELSAW